MLGTGGRWLPVVLPLLLMAGVGAVLAKSEGNDRTAETAPKPEVGKTLGLAGAFSPVGSHFGSDSQRVVFGFLAPARPFRDGASPTSSYLHALPDVPKPFLMALVGFVCISLVNDRRIWLAAVASVLSCGQCWVNAVPQLCRQHGHRERYQQPPCVSAVLPLSESQISTCIGLYQQAMRGINDRRGMNAAQALVLPPRVFDLLEPRPAAIANPRVFLSSLPKFAQLGRGPPPVS